MRVSSPKRHYLKPIITTFSTAGNALEIVDMSINQACDLLIDLAKRRELEGKEDKRKSAECQMQVRPISSAN